MIIVLKRATMTCGDEIRLVNVRNQFYEINHYFRGHGTMWKGLCYGRFNNPEEAEEEFNHLAAIEGSPEIELYALTKQVSELKQTNRELVRKIGDLVRQTNHKSQ